MVNKPGMKDHCLSKGILSQQRIGH